MNWRILSLWQPWAQLCVTPDPDRNNTPAKQIETRHFRPIHKLPIKVAIHATKKIDRDNSPYLWMEPFASTLKRCGFYPGDPRPFIGKTWALPKISEGLELLPLGAIVGVVEIVGVAAAEHLQKIPESERVFGNYAPDRYGWFFAKQHQLLEPIPFSGRQDVLYEPSIEIQRQIDEQLATMGVAA